MYHKQQSKMKRTVLTASWGIKGVNDGRKMWDMGLFRPCELDKGKEFEGGQNLTRYFLKEEMPKREKNFGSLQLLLSPFSHGPPLRVEPLGKELDNHGPVSPIFS